MLRPVRCRIGACFPDRAHLTDVLRKEDLDDRLSLRVLVQIPCIAVLPLRAGDSLLVPVNVEVFDLSCPRSASLPTGIDMDRPHHINPVGFSTVQDAFGTDRARIDERHVREGTLSLLHLLGWGQGHDDLVQLLARFRLV